MKLGLLGKGISYSLSPVIFETISKQLDVSLSYELFDVNSDQIQSIVNKMRKKEIKGLNVTKPYKVEIMSYCDDISDDAKRIGAVNTLVLKDGRIYGDNTDSYGFKALLDVYQIELLNKSICILGNGGSSKAVFHTIKAYENSITIVKRKTSKQESITQNEIFYEDVKKHMCDVWIQTTTVGLKQDDKALFDYNLVENDIVIDLIYHRETEIMKASKKSFGGMMMLIFQALRSFEIWRQMTLNNVLDLSVEIKEVLEHELSRQQI